MISCPAKIFSSKRTQDPNLGAKIIGGNGKNGANVIRIQNDKFEWELVLAIDIGVALKILINHEVCLNSSEVVSEFKKLSDCKIPVIKKDEPADVDRGIIVQVEPEKRPYPYLTEENSSVRANDFESATNGKLKSETDAIQIPKPGYDLAHCKERGFYGLMTQDSWVMIHEKRFERHQNTNTIINSRWSIV